MSIILRIEEHFGNYLHWIQVSENGDCQIFESDKQMSEEEAQVKLQEYLDGLTQ